MDFESLLQEKYNFSLKPQQRDAVLNADGPAMLLAVPGSGKTTVIAARCAYLILGCGIPAENILTLAVNRSTQKDMELRFHRIFGHGFPKGLRFTTIHSFCSLVLREYGALMGTKPPKLIEEGKRRLLRSLYGELNDNEFLPDDRLEELINAISYTKNNMLATGQISDNSFSTRNFSRIFAAYEEYKKNNGCMDYDDMPAQALAAFDDKPGLLERFRAQYRYINADDVQEMSILQYAVIQQLAAPKNNLFMAGDEDLSIERSRTANPEIMHNFNEAYPDARVLVMERNYRSTHAIVDAASRLIKNNASRHISSMNTGNEIGMPVEETNLSDNNMLCDYLAARIKSEPEYSGLAILYRDSTSAVTIVDMLDRESIPFSIQDQRLAFFEHWVVRDILAFMALSENPGDSAALKQIYYKLNAYISKSTFAQAEAMMGEGGYPDVLDALMKSASISINAATRLKKLKESMVTLPAMLPGSAVQFIVEKLGYGEYLKKAGGEGPYLDSLLQIAESLKTIASRTNNYSELLERITALAAVADCAKGNTDANAVALSTVHGVRGMEFRKVFVVDLFEGRFPSIAAIFANNEGKKELLEEERRLCYMAVTRACKHVELIYAAKINGERVKASRFIRELLPLAPVRKARPARTAKPAAEGSPVRAFPARRAAARKPTGVKQVAQKATPEESLNLDVGADIEHKSFGHGIISAYDVKRDIVAVKFPKHGVKTFAATFCVNGGVLKKPVLDGDAGGSAMQAGTENAITR